MIAQQRETNPNVLLLDGGDTLFSDRPLTRRSEGALIIEAMNLMGYDAMVLGEGDLQLGVGPLQQRISEAEFAVLSANVRLAGEEELLVDPFTIIQVGDHRVGILGLTAVPETVPAGLAIDDPFQAARRTLPAVFEQADMVIILSRLGFSENVRLADLSPQVDLIVGGGREPLGRQPHQADSTGTRLTQAERPTRGHAGRYVGLWELVLEPDGRVTFTNWFLIPLLPAYPDDPAVAELVKRYAAGP